MANVRYPLLRGQTVASPFKAVIGGSRSASPPRPDPASHRPKLLAQLDAIVADVQSRPAGVRDPDAAREIIAVRPADPTDPLKAEQLADVRHDIRVVSVDPQSGVVLLDAPGPNLEKLRQKAGEYGELQQKKREDGTVVTSRKHEAALGPVEEIALAGERDLVGPRLQEWAVQGTMPSVDTKLWFELACRGGYRNPPEWSVKSRDQICRQIYPITNSIPQQFEAPEERVFFARLSLRELRRVVAAVDCVFTYDVVPRDILTWLTLQTTPRREIREFRLEAPPPDAPAVVVLDTGVATEHPLLKSAVLSATSVVPGMLDAPGDSYGHGSNMAGVALYPDLARALEERRFAASHWLQSVRLIAEPLTGAAAEDDRPYWPSRTASAVATAEEADSRTRPRVYALAVTFPIKPVLPTSWAQAVDQLAFNAGRGRLFCVAAGNVQPEDLLAASNAYPDSLQQWKIHDPAQGSNALTVGAYTDKARLPPEDAYVEASVVAPAGGAAPHTTTGMTASPWPIKPDIVMEGGNVALNGPLADPHAETLVTLTTGHRHLTHPLSWLCMTSEATARAARFCADVWKQDASLRPETVRGLVVHSASWTPAMREQFGEPDMFAACGYGVPDLEFACACAADRATVVVEDRMPNAVLIEKPRTKAPKRSSTPLTQPGSQRVLKAFRLPAPEDLLLAQADAQVELRVTLSYFPEPSTFRTRVEHGLDLKWDMQGPQESEAEFLERINDLLRPRDERGKKIKKDRKSSFEWAIGINRRSRGTVQSDRWSGAASMLAGSKLIAVYPVLGWWERRREMFTSEMPFSLIVSIVSPGIHSAVQAELATVVSLLA